MEFVPRKALLALPVLLLGVSTLVAAPDPWNGSVDNKWFTPGNWDGNNPPTALDNAQIGTSAVSPATVQIDGPGAVAKNVFLGFDSGTSGTLRMNNHDSLSVGNNLNVGDASDSTGTFVMKFLSSANVGNDLNIANALGSMGDATVEEGAGLTVAGVLRVGRQGAGTLTIANVGTVAANNINVGVLPGSNGSVDVSQDAGFIVTNLGSTNDIQIGDQGTGTMTIHDGGIVVASKAGVIGNTGTGIGTVVVTGENSGQASRWTVGTNLTVGDLGIGELDVSDGGEVDVTNNMAIARQGTSTGTVVVSGTGSLSGTPAVLSIGHNAFVGGDNGGPGGDGSLTIEKNGVVDVTGNMTVWGPGTGNRGLLEVDSTYTLNVGGTLIFDGGRLHLLDGTDFINPALLNSSTGPIGMVVAVNDDDSASITGNLSGLGNLVKEGTGTLLLDETGLYNNTVINNGTFIVGNTDALGLGNLNLNDGTLRTPEGTPLSVMVANNFNANGGRLIVQIGGTNSGTDSDEYFVAGTANLSTNSNLLANRVNGYNPNAGDVVTIISANGLSGTFAQGQGAQISSSDPAHAFLGLIQPFVDYGNLDANSVDLFFAFSAPFVSVAKTPNQIAVAEALDKARAAQCIVHATNVLGNYPPIPAPGTNNPSLNQVYDLIAPEELASIYETGFAQAMAQSINLQRRMDDIRWGSTGFCADGFVVQDNHGYTKNDGKSVADKNPVEQAAPPNYRWGTFVTGTGELTKVGQEDDNARGYQINNASFTMGADYRVSDHFAIGIDGGYTNSRAKLVNDGRLTTDGGNLGLFATYYTGGFYVDGAASGGWNQYDTRRTAFLGQETGSTDGAAFNGMVAAGYDWKRGCWTFGPYADFEYTYVEFNSFTEDDRSLSTSSSLIPLHYGDQNESAYRTNLGFRIAHEQVYKPGEGLNVVPEVRVAWRHEFGDNSYPIESNFVGCDDTFTVHGPWVGSDSAVVDLGLTAYCTQQLSASIFYTGQFGRDNYNNSAITGGLRFAF